MIFLYRSIFILFIYALSLANSPFKFILIFSSFTWNLLLLLYFLISFKYRLWKALKANNMGFKISVFTFKKQSLEVICEKGLQACNFIKNRLQHRSFPVKFAKLIRAPFLRNICEWLLLTFFDCYVQNELPIFIIAPVFIHCLYTCIGSPFSAES